jgi:hypothetical protein
MATRFTLGPSPSQAICDNGPKAWPNGIKARSEWTFKFKQVRTARGESFFKFLIGFSKTAEQYRYFSVSVMAIPCGNVKTSPSSKEFTLSRFSPMIRCFVF